MTRKHRKNKKGGFLGMDTSNWLTDWTSGLSNNSTWMPWGTKKNQSLNVPTSTPYVAPPIQPQPQLQPPQPSSNGTGGKKRRTRHGKRGGDFSSNISQTNLAANASPVSGINTVSAQTWVGGKTKRRRNKRNKSRKHKK
jgi:hypothetical protein